MLPVSGFFDKKLKEISFMPANGITDPNLASTGIPMINQLVEVKGKVGQPVRNLRIYGLTFEGVITGQNVASHNWDGIDGSTGVAEVKKPSNTAISYEFAHACEFADGEVRSCNGLGILVKTGCYQTRILKSRSATNSRASICER